MLFVVSSSFWLTEWYRNVKIEEYFCEMESHRLKNALSQNERMRMNEKKVNIHSAWIGPHSLATPIRWMLSLFIFHCLPKWAFNIYERILTAIYHREWISLRQNQFIKRRRRRRLHHENICTKLCNVCKGFPFHLLLHVDMIFKSFVLEPRTMT